MAETPDTHDGRARRAGPQLGARIRTAASWVVGGALAGSGVLFALTALGVTVPPHLVAAQAAAPLQLLVAAGGATTALVARSRLLLPAVVLVVAWTAFCTLAGRAAGDGAGPCTGPSLTVAAANVMLTNPRQGQAHHQGAAAATAALEADVLVTAETSPRLRADLAAAGWRHVARGAGQRGTTTDLWARDGVVVVDRRTVSTGASSLPAAQVATGDGGTLWVVGVHLVAPSTSEQADVWRSELAALPKALSDLGGHVVLAGDFNTSIYHRGFAPLLDAYADAGRGTGRTWVRTWPADTWWGPLFDLDHILVRHGTGLCAYGETPLPGSDHLAVWATVSTGTTR